MNKNGISKIKLLGCGLVIFGFILIIFNGYPTSDNWQREAAESILNWIVPGLGMVGLGLFLIKLNSILGI